MNLVKASVLGLLLLAAPAAESAEVTLLYNGSVQAELHDCGCKTRPLGGLARRAALIESTCAGRETLLLDAGNLLGDPTGDTFGVSKFVAIETAAMGYAAAGVGPYEIGHGIDAVQSISASSGLPFVSANLSVDGERPFAPWIVVERAGVRFGVTSVVDPGYLREPYDRRADGVEIEDPAAALARELPRLREQCDVVVLLAAMEGGSAGLVAGLGDDLRVDLVIEGTGSRHDREPRVVGDTFVVAANSKGKYLGQLDLAIDDGRISATRAEMHALDLDLPEQEELAMRVAGFEKSEVARASSR